MFYYSLYQYSRPKWDILHTHIHTHKPVSLFCTHRDKEIQDAAQPEQAQSFSSVIIVI